MKLHLGCGTKIKEGYINIDLLSSKADMTADCSELPFEVDSASLIESYHLIEHMTKVKAMVALEHWYGLLKPGGLLVLECPDIEEVMRQYLQGNEEMLYSVYGRYRHPYDSHCWGYSRSSLTSILKAIGFKEVKVSNGTDYHSNFEPCMRAEASK
jgi:predicted SAM-dependent methyltransferase